MNSEQRTGWRRLYDGEMTRWFALPHIDSKLLGEDQSFAWMGGWLKEDGGKKYMIPDTRGEIRLWFGLLTKTNSDSLEKRGSAVQIAQFMQRLIIYLKIVSQ